MKLQLLSASMMGLALAQEVPRVLFIGNSFTYVNELPEQLKNVAASLGQEIEVASSTIGGCTLYHQEASVDKNTAKLLEEEWDYIVLQDYSALPTVSNARDAYLYPAVKDFVSQKKRATVAMYMTWAYYGGQEQACPSSDNKPCFPLGTLADLTEPDCSKDPTYQQTMGSFECMGYALARGYLSALDLGADIVVPCGLTWQTIRGSQNIPDQCKDAIDAEYPSPMPVELPLPVVDSALPDLMLYRNYSTSGIDKHPNVAGQYLNALTFYAALFGSPVGAAAPLETGDPFAGDRPLTDDEMLTMQRAAEGTVNACGKACNL